MFLRTSEAAFAGAVDAAQLIAASAKEAGITVEVKREPKDGYWSNIWNKEPWCACYWGGRPTEDWMFVSAYTNDIKWNDTSWRGTEDSKKFNDLVVQARGELDEAKRRTMYAECQTLIHNDGGAIVPMFANYIHGNSKKLAHAKRLPPTGRMTAIGLPSAGGSTRKRRSLNETQYQRRWGNLPPFSV